MSAAKAKHSGDTGSLQVLQEYFTAVTKKKKLDAGIARCKVEFYARFRVSEPGVGDILAAIDMHRLYEFSYWDALVLRMAKQTGCRNCSLKTFSMDESWMVSRSSIRSDNAFAPNSR
jgi:predicted nucleic acid-binding protein